MSRFPGKIKSLLSKKGKRIVPQGLIFREFQESLGIIEDVDQIALNFLGTVKEAVPVERLAFFIHDGDLAQFRIVSSFGMDEEAVEALAFSSQGHLARWLKVNKTGLDVRGNRGAFEFLGDGEKGVFERLGLEICFPLLSMNRLVGILGLGPKSVPGSYSKADLAFIESLTPQAGIALENALLYREQRERYRRMLRADRLATIGELAAGAAHEIRNPLTAIKSSLQYLEGRCGEDVERKLLRTALEETSRIDEILSGLLSFARPSEPKKSRFDLIGLLEETLSLVNYQARASDVAIRPVLPRSPIFANGDRGQLKQLFLNVFLNALQAMSRGGELALELVAAEGRKVLVKVSDTGVGIPDEDLDRIFDPFFTTKKGGTGLGLSICYGIVKSHEGDIEIKSRRGEGTRVLITLPLS
jgi:signal transduction histidine kinase